MVYVKTKEEGVGVMTQGVGSHSQKAVVATIMASASVTEKLFRCDQNP